MDQLEPPDFKNLDRPPNEFDVRLRRLDRLSDAGHPIIAALLDLAQTKFGLTVAGGIGTAFTVAFALIRLL